MINVSNSITKNFNSVLNNTNNKITYFCYNVTDANYYSTNSVDYLHLR